MITTQRNIITLFAFFCVATALMKSMEPPQSPERQKQTGRGLARVRRKKIVKKRQPEIPADATPANKALLMAAAAGSKRGVVRALKAKADIEMRALDGRNSLALAVSKGHAEVAELLLDGGADIEATPVTGYTPLYIAAQRGDEAIVKLLLERNADTGATTHERATPLHVAVHSNHEGVVRLLVNGDANIEAATINGFTPLHLAVQHGHEAILRLLLHAGANTDTATIHGLTPLIIAAERRNFAVMRELLRWGARLPPTQAQAYSSAIDAFAERPLSGAVIAGDVAEMRRLIEPETRNFEILEALVYAIAQSHEQIVEELISLMMQRGGMNEVYGEPLLHANRLRTRPNLTPEQAAGYGRIRTLILASTDSLVIQAGWEHSASSHQRRVIDFRKF